MSRNRFTMLGAALGVAALLAGLGSSVSSAASGKASSSSYSMYLSNSTLAGDWRVQMVKTAQLAAHASPFKGHVNLTVVNDTDPSVSTQLSNVTNIIGKKPAALLIDAVSPNAFNSTLTRACAQHMVIVSFDGNVTAPCAYKIIPAYTKTSYNGARWMFKKMGGKGTILLDQGLAGDPNSALLTAGVMKALKKAPGIKVGGKYSSSYAPGPTESGIASLLSSNSDVKGVIAFGPNCGAVLTAFSTAHRPAPYVFCTGAPNGALVQCATTKGAACYDGAFPPYVVAIAMRTALNVLHGKKVAKSASFTVPCIVSGHAPGCISLKLGVNAVKSAPAGLTFPVAPSWLKIPVKGLT